MAGWWPPAAGCGRQTAGGWVVATSCRVWQADRWWLGGGHQLQGVAGRPLVAGWWPPAAECGRQTAGGWVVAGGWAAGQLVGAVAVSQLTTDVHVCDTVVAVIIVIVSCRVASCKNRKRFYEVRAAVRRRLACLLSQGVVAVDAVDGVREHVVGVRAREVATGKGGRRATSRLDVNAP